MSGAPGSRRPSLGERLLHRVALGSAPARELAYDLEQARYGRAADVLASPQPVFVSGLARAGTTVLMRMLHGTGHFAALSYRDMPFALAPNTWARLSGGTQRQVQARERGHGDGVLHDLDSPEAIEEVFWLHHEGERYLSPSGLVPVPPRDATVIAFTRYLRLVQLRHGRPRYLSKNNNNLLRLPALLQSAPDATLLHPFRDPLQQAASLRAQHRRACALAADDPFRVRYMGWLGHHEFGADQRPFLLAGAPLQSLSRDHLDYWLQLWSSVYAHLLTQPPQVRQRQVFIDYDLLAGQRTRFAARLGQHLGLDAPVPMEDFQPAPLRMPGQGPSAALDQALAVHARLRRHALAWLDADARLRSPAA
ncbi:Sulfotransferase family protein [Pseudoxanthomonas sp. GM95]|uniref:sulfotransferase n=1 Tax=Pseudoxanthomonas sp. GM95 TaxID=1881043 RepID=UPI0008BCDEE4|nr:sulfotransferase [Pseudoxanthomonas sp. GM95]SEM24370.1 Sulfotransferase family protein [Pseudoxanthomonas sp. GM95]